MMLNKNLANDVAKLRIRKEKDFNITEFLWIRFVFLWNKACCFIIIRYLCTIHRIQVSQVQKLKELSLPTVAEKLRQQSFWRSFLSSKTYVLTP